MCRTGSDCRSWCIGPSVDGVVRVFFFLSEATTYERGSRVLLVYQDKRLEISCLLIVQSPHLVGFVSAPEYADSRVVRPQGCMVPKLFFTCKTPLFW
jgi:hypothetical protein